MIETYFPGGNCEQEKVMLKRVEVLPENGLPSVEHFRSRLNWNITWDWEDSFSLGEGGLEIAFFLNYLMTIVWPRETHSLENKPERDDCLRTIHFAPAEELLYLVIYSYCLIIREQLTTSN